VLKVEEQTCFLQATGGNTRRATSIPAPIAANGQHAADSEEEDEEDEEEVGLQHVQSSSMCHVYEDIWQVPYC
jgi:hypothetical protein